MQCNTALQKHNLRRQISAFVSLCVIKIATMLTLFLIFVRKKDLFLPEIHQSFGCPVHTIQIFPNINCSVFLSHLFESVLLPIAAFVSSRIVSSLLSNKHSQQQPSAHYKWGVRHLHGMSWHVLQPRNLRYSNWTEWWHAYILLLIVKIVSSNSAHNPDLPSKAKRLIHLSALIQGHIFKRILEHLSGKKSS